ncbi:hypothetical protein ACSSS7_005372 [Eimeria intestinalis]
MSVYMDYQNRVGHKLGSGAPATWQEMNLERKERLRRLALETIDLNKDPYFMRNHLGKCSLCLSFCCSLIIALLLLCAFVSVAVAFAAVEARCQFECRLCLTLHTNEGSYLSHTQGKKHQTNLSRRLAKEKADAVVAPMPLKTSSGTGRSGDRVRIGRPGYRVTKLRDERTRQFALLCEVEYPEIVKGTKPYHRFMSAFEQRVETPPDGNYQFLLFAAEPYETIAFKIPNMEIDRDDPRHHAGWDDEKKVYTMQIFFTRRQPRPLPALPQRPTTFLPLGARW